MNLRTNPELLPLVEWWEKDGKSTVIWLLIAAIAVGGWYGWKNHKAAVKAAASDAACFTACLWFFQPYQPPTAIAATSSQITVDLPSFSHHSTRGSNSGFVLRFIPCFLSLRRGLPIR